MSVNCIPSIEKRIEVLDRWWYLTAYAWATKRSLFLAEEGVVTAYVLTFIAREPCVEGASRAFLTSLHVMAARQKRVHPTGINYFPLVSQTSSLGISFLPLYHFCLSYFFLRWKNESESILEDFFVQKLRLVFCGAGKWRYSGFCWKFS